MNKTPGVFIVLLVLVGLSACAVGPWVQFAPSRVDKVYAVRTAPDAIELFRSSSPTRKYAEIGAVNACCNYDATALTGLLRQKASEMGGDALIGLDIRADGSATASVIRYE